ncbi:unnamed protein product [marine sediment metagenome]|uniref:Uncharacterized protein n=1 Tax=marine sediment metagenome TaxID=412755 RepID=X1NDF2_9ZZZZ
MSEQKQSAELEEVDAGEVAETEPGQLTELERKTVFIEEVKDAFMLDIEAQEGLEPGHSVRVRAKRDTESGVDKILAVGRPDDLDEVTEVLAAGGYDLDMGKVTDKSIEKARVKFPHLYRLAEQLGLPPPATEAEVEQIAEAAKEAPVGELEAAEAAVAAINEEKEGEQSE